MQTKQPLRAKIALNSQPWSPYVPVGIDVDPMPLAVLQIDNLTPEALMLSTFLVIEIFKHFQSTNLDYSVI